MSRTNEFKIEAKVLGDVKSKSFGDKTVHEWLIGIGAKKQDGTWDNVLLPCKKWGNTKPSRGDIVTMVGRIGAEAWGDGNKKLVFMVDKIEGLGESEPITEESNLPF